MGPLVAVGAVLAWLLSGCNRTSVKPPEKDKHTIDSYEEAPKKQPYEYTPKWGGGMKL